MLSRNLLYTAVTRGKSKVCVIGEKNIFLKEINLLKKNPNQNSSPMNLPNQP